MNTDTLDSATSPSPIAPAYIVGGTLHPDSPRYLERKADKHLYDALLRHDFCYVLNTRQMGKSSLMAKTAQRLTLAGRRVAILDLTALGLNLSPEQWYLGLLTTLANRLGKRKEALAFWKDRSGLSPLQRFLEAIVEIALPDPPGHEGEGLTIFLDEIDALRSLPFSGDELIIGIRHLYNLRAEDPALSRLSFCILGVAAPSDLVEDTRVSPFNIGQRIKLDDFTPEEAAPLVDGLGINGTALLARILYWTGGHPFLTQRLCFETTQRLTSGTQLPTPDTIDTLVRELYLSNRAKESDDNLAFVRNRLLHSEGDRAAALTLYERVRRGKVVPDAETDPLCSLLKLSGIAKAEGARLVVRNRLYREAFDHKWIIEQMPDAELQRQKSAYRKGMWRAALVGSAISIVLVGLTISNVLNARRAYASTEEVSRQRETALTSAKEADIQRNAALLSGAEATRQRNAAITSSQQAINSRTLADRKTQEALRQRSAASESARKEKLASLEANQQRNKALLNEQTSIQSLKKLNETYGKLNNAEVKAKQEARTAYFSSLNLFPRDWTVQNIRRISDTLESTPFLSEGGFEWGYWNRLCHLDLKTLDTGTSDDNSVAFSPDGKWIVAGGANKSAIVWNAPSGRKRLVLTPTEGEVTSVAVSPDGKRIVTGDTKGVAIVWDSGTGKRLLTLRGHNDSIRTVACSPDGQQIATGGDDKKLVVWDAQTGKSAHPAFKHSGTIDAVAFSPDSKQVATGCRDFKTRIWEVSTGEVVRTLAGHGWFICGVVFSHDGKQLVTASGDNNAVVWNVKTGEPITYFRGHRNQVTHATYTADGKSVITCGLDNAAIVWNPFTGKESFRFRGHIAGVSSVAVSPDGAYVATVSRDKTARIWDATGDHVALRLNHKWGVTAASFSSDGNTLVTGGLDKTVRVWDARTGRSIHTLEGHTDFVIGSAFLPDNRRALTVSRDGTAKLWDVKKGTLLKTFAEHKNAINAVAVSPNGKLFATAGWDKQVLVWEVGKDHSLYSIPYEFGLKTIAFSHGGSLFVTGDEGGNVIVREVATGKEQYRLVGHTKPVRGVNFSSDDKFIVTGSADTTVKIWDAQTHGLIRSINAHQIVVTSAAFSPDGKRLLTAGYDNLAKIWDTATGIELLALDGHANVVEGAVFTQDGKRIVTFSQDHTAMLWSSEGKSRQPILKPSIAATR